MIKVTLLSMLILLFQTVNGVMQEPGGGELACPVANCSYITQGFSERHHAVDYAYYLGSPVYAAASGVVYRAGENCMTDPCAHAVTLLHDGGWLATNYWHLNGVYVRQGQAVERGDVIGTIGMTGITTGPHLHFSVQSNRTFVNPIEYM